MNPVLPRSESTRTNGYATPPSGSYYGAGQPPGAPYTAAPDPAPRHKGRTARTAATVALAAVLGSAITFGAVEYADGVHGTGTAATSLAAPAQAAPAVASNWTAVAAKAAPSVVAIRVTGANGGDQGSGVVWDNKGDIVTNNHVVSSQGAGAKIQVRVGAQDTYAATIVGTDPSTDLAVVRLDKPPTTLTPIQRGDSTTLKVGDPVMALGNPLGLSGTVTTGIVSALDRPVTTTAVPSPSTVPMGDFTGGSPTPVVTDAIQTNAAINPGNSGGALVDGNGALVGINSAIASLGQSSSGGQSGNIGIGFAIPIHEVTSIVDQLIQTGHARVPYLGISTHDATVKQGQAQISGAGVNAVAPDSPAAAAGLKRGDVITGIDGVPVDGATSLVGRIRGDQPTQQITVTIHRSGQTQDIHLTLQPKPAN